MLWKAITCSIFASLPFQFAAMPASAASSEMQTQPTNLSPQTAFYQAPLRDPGGAGPIVPGSYGVFLFPGRSIEQHSIEIQTDITPYIMHIFDKLWTDRVVYSAGNIDDELLAKIRKDPGVEFVEMDHAPPPLG
ncbi:hypothetical protein BKA64DRAFT_665189 [Cadophora sp. MPI-SDFR-AT-0126]|nr:hypothetical protein BKA64DRAFT_665189 [Leotiomycetes sp. MPI-SDFR-AT-0126]